VLARSSTVTASASGGRSPSACSAWPFIDAGRSRPRAARTVGATSMSCPKGARPVLAEVSQRGSVKAGPEAIPTCSCARPSLTSEMPWTSSSVSPGAAATASTSRPSAASMPVSAAARGSGSVPVSLVSRSGSPASTRSPRPTSTSGQPVSSSPGSAGSCSRWVSVTPGAATASAGARPTTVAQPTASPSAAGSAPNRAVAGSAATAATAACGSASPGLRQPLLQAAVRQRRAGRRQRRGGLLRRGVVRRGRVVSPALPPGGLPGQRDGRQRHRRDRLVGCREARTVSCAQGGPAVEHAAGRAGGPHRHRADRRTLGQRPELRGGLRVDVVPHQPGDADDDHAVGRRPLGRRGARGMGGDQHGEDGEQQRREPGHRGAPSSSR
jgi:hypothetical protein